MNVNEVDDAIAWLRQFIDPVDVHSVILFGSAVRGEAGPESDIDLLIFPKSAAARTRVEERVRAVERDLGVKISPIYARDLNAKELDRQMLESIVRSGRPLIGHRPKFDVDDLDLEPVRIVELDLRSLDQAKKVRLERRLFGAHSTKKVSARTYSSRSPGCIDEWGGRRIGRSIILVPESAVPKLELVLADAGARRVLVPGWVQRP